MEVLLVLVLKYYVILFLLHAKSELKDAVFVVLNAILNSLQSPDLFLHCRNRRGSGKPQQRLN